MYASDTPPPNSWYVPHCVEPQIKAWSGRVSKTLVAKVGASRPDTVAQRYHPKCFTCHLPSGGSVRSLSSSSTFSSLGCSLRSNTGRSSEIMAQAQDRVSCAFGSKNDALNRISCGIPTSNMGVAYIYIYIYYILIYTWWHAHLLLDQLNTCVQHMCTSNNKGNDII